MTVTLVLQWEFWQGQSDIPVLLGTFFKTRPSCDVKWHDTLLFCRCGWMLLSRYSILWVQDLVSICPTPVTTPSTTTACGKYSDVIPFHSKKRLTIQFLPDYGTFGVVPWLGLSVARLFPRRTRFDTRWVHLGFAVQKVALGHFFSQYVSFPLSVPFHQCSILINSSTTDAM